MKTIYTGKGRITLLTLLAIWSISLVVDLPGLAITPVLSELDTIFPHATHLEIQLLSVLPNFCIIPFILLSGKMSTSRSKTSLINLGMAIFLAAGVACFFARSMTALIVISCGIGIGCGIVIPLAAGVIADFFTGEPRMRQMGIKSGIANFTLVLCTLAVGWMGGRDWHLPFVVYLIPVVPLCLSPFLRDDYVRRTEQLNPAASPVQTATARPDATSRSEAYKSAVTSRKSRRRTIAGIMIFYFAITICTITISYYIPFVMQDYGMPDSWTGIVTSVFFLFITLAGFTLPFLVRTFRNSLTLWAMIMMIGGLVLIVLFRSLWIYIAAVVAVGLGYGMLQPIFYNKASMLAPDTNDSTRVLSFVMAANYLGTAVTPLIFTGLKDAFHIPGHDFTFWLSIAVLASVLVWNLLKRQSFIFYTSPSDT